MGLGFYSMENQTEKNMEHEMETTMGFVLRGRRGLGFRGVGASGFGVWALSLGVLG